MATHAAARRATPVLRITRRSTHSDLAALLLDHAERLAALPAALLIGDASNLQHDSRRGRRVDRAGRSRRTRHAGAARMLRGRLQTGRRGAAMSKPAYPRVTAEAMRAWRREAGLSAAEAAKLVYVAPRTWLRWESGEAAVARSTAAMFELAQLKFRRKRP